MRILVVDDEPVQGEGLAQYLTDHGHEADWVVCLIGALGCMRLRHYDVIVTDLMIKCIGPRQLIDGLRAAPGPPTLVALTAAPEGDPVLDVLPPGTIVLHKPVDPERVLHVVVEAAAGRSLPGPTLPALQTKG